MTANYFGFKFLKDSSLKRGESSWNANAWILIEMEEEALYMFYLKSPEILELELPPEWFLVSANVQLRSVNTICWAS